MKCSTNFMKHFKRTSCRNKIQVITSFKEVNICVRKIGPAILKIYQGQLKMGYGQKPEGNKTQGHQSSQDPRYKNMTKDSVNIELL